MAKTYTELDHSMNEVARKMTALVARQETHLAGHDGVVDGMAEVQVDHGDDVVDILAQAAANPADPAWAALKARADRLATDFVATSNDATAVRDAARGALS